MTCPTCGNTLAFFAVACPHCGNPSFGSLIQQSIAASQQESKPSQITGEEWAAIFKFLMVVGLVVAFAVALTLGIMWGSESELVATVTQKGLVGLKWFTLTALAFLPFGIISGLITQSSENDFLPGYIWGQLTGPIGLIVIIFQIPDHRGSRGGPRLMDEPPKPPPPQVRHVSKLHGESFRFTCPKCKKNYKISQRALGKELTCVRCGHLSIISINLN